MSGKDDDEHLKCAILNDAVLLTIDENFPKDSNCKNIQHKGILINYQFNNPKKDMTPLKIIRALKNIEKLKLDLKNKIYKLNDFNY